MSAHWAVPGAKCVCIAEEFDNSLSIGRYSVPTRTPMLNEVLTVASARPWEGGGIGGTIGEIYLTFYEIEETQKDGPLSATITFAANCFRPIVERKTDISVFTAMLTEQRQTEPV